MDKQPAKNEQNELDQQQDYTDALLKAKAEMSKRPRENGLDGPTERQKEMYALDAEINAAYISKDREPAEPLEMVFTAAGNEYEIPKDLEEYRKENPNGANIITAQMRGAKFAEYLNDNPSAEAELISSLAIFAQLFKDNITEPLKEFYNSGTWTQFKDIWGKITTVLPEMQQQVSAIMSVMDFIPDVIAGTEYAELTTEEFFERMDKAEPEEQKRFADLYEQAKTLAQKSTKKKEKHKKSVISKQAATEEKEKAKQENAVMEINNLVFFTGNKFDFSNSLYKLGEAKPEDFNQFGCYIGAKERLTSATEIAPQLRGFITTLIGGTVDNYREELVRTGKITFYVKGVAESLNSDFRNKRNGTETDRKNARRAFLESEINKATGFVCALPDGSSFSVLNYYGYNPISDTMTIESPYYYELWRLTQKDFFDRLEDKESRALAKKYIPKDDYTPLEVNTLFTAKAYMENSETLEIAEYILKNMLQAGLGEKDFHPSYQTVINHCPTFKRSLDNIKSGEDGKNKETRLQRYNRALCKFTSAYKLIKDKEKCTATSLFDNISVKSDLPYMVVKGNIEKDMLTSPTNSTLHKKFTISWTHSRQE